MASRSTQSYTSTEGAGARLPVTGEPCARAGLYQSHCKHWRMVTLDRGQRFPRCPECDGAVFWEWIRTTEA